MVVATVPPWKHDGMAELHAGTNIDRSHQKISINHITCRPSSEHGRLSRRSHHMHVLDGD
jgi:hypothetical protein